MNIYKGTLTLFSTLTPMKFSTNPIYPDMMMGVIYSTVDYMKPAYGATRQIFDAELANCAHPEIAHFKLSKTPIFIRQREIFAKNQVDTTRFIAANEQIYKKALLGEIMSTKYALDLVNMVQTFRTLQSVQSYDVSKLSGTNLHYRPGFHDEYYEHAQGRLSLKGVPVLTDDKQVFGSLLDGVNLAPIDEDTKTIVTVMLGFGFKGEHYNRFSHNLAELQKNQELEAGIKTIQTAVVCGYPCTYHADKTITPSIVVGFS